MLEISQWVLLVVVFVALVFRERRDIKKLNQLLQSAEKFVDQLRKEEEKNYDNPTAAQRLHEKKFRDEKNNEPLASVVRPCLLAVLSFAEKLILKVRSFCTHRP